MNNQEREERLQATRAKYGDNHWWVSDDPHVLAYFQINEPILCIDGAAPFQRFYAAIERLLGRPVQTFEFGLNIEGLRAEAEAAYHGTPYGDEDKGAAIRDSLERLIALKGQDHVIAVSVSKDDASESEARS